MKFYLISGVISKGPGGGMAYYEKAMESRPNTIGSTIN